MYAPSFVGKTSKHTPQNGRGDRLESVIRILHHIRELIFNAKKIYHKFDICM